MRLKLKTAPAVEPISTADMKTHLRVDIVDDDALIDNLIKVARQYCETFTRKAFITQTWELFLDEFPDNDDFDSDDFLYIPKSPTQSIVSIKYNDENGILQTLNSSNYILDTQTNLPARLSLTENGSYPDTQDQVNSVTIEFIAGYGNLTTDIPSTILQAMYLLVGSWYENREAITLFGTPKQIPLAVETLLWSERVEQV